MSDPISKALQVLNEALELDPSAITELVNLRVGCNKGLTNHATIHVGVYDGVAKVGVLGLINGVIGNSPSGVIGAKGSIDGQTGRFVRVQKFVDLRNEKTDVIA